MKVLLSIKPEFADKIFSGEKKYEYRKVIFKREVSTVVVYATCPVGRVIGEFEIDSVLSEPPRDLWEKTKDFSGITKAFFSEYFNGREKGYAIKVGKIKKYKEALPPTRLFDKNFVAPQSFRYLPA
jgi:predicted transcriptional regulator